MTVVFGEQLNIDTISTFKIFALMNHQAAVMCNFINQTSVLCSVFIIRFRSGFDV